MTFLDQQNKLSRLLGDSNTSSGDQWPVAERQFEINRGEVQFSRDSKILTEYATGSIASGELAVPTDWIETYILIVGDIVITNDNEIALQDWERWKSWGGTPPKYYFWEFSGTRKIKFLPESNTSVYKLYYFKKPTTSLSADVDESLLPDEYREASVYYAASELLEQVGKTQLADRYRLKYQFFVDKAESDVEKQYLNKGLPRPDFGPGGALDAVDRQGQRSW